MRRKNRATLLSFFTTLLIFTPIFLYISHNVFSGETIHLPQTSTTTTTPLKNPSTNNLVHLSYLIEEDLHLSSSSNISKQVSSSTTKDSLPDSILLPDWEVLYITEEDLNTSDIDDNHQYICVFQNNATSVAEFTGSLRNSKRFMFKCNVPGSVQRLRPLLSPILTNLNESWSEKQCKNWPEMLRWNYLAYESLSTENDVVLFVKGVNNRQGVNRSPEEFNCVFENGVNYSVKTVVTSSYQEVFRCSHPNKTEISRLFKNGGEKVRVSLEIKGGQSIVPSVAYYSLYKQQNEREDTTYSQLCACTMVHNVGKFLKEWIVYHSKLGVGKFILYDNDSDDDLGKVVQELVLDEEYNVEIVNWPWPKTQEAGFSHSAIYAKGSCKWMMYMDVDEFVFSPSWLNATAPTSDMLLSLLPTTEVSSSPSSAAETLPPSSDILPWLSRPIGQVYIKCLEFGPSNQQSHPIAGVTQGYTCRRRAENRHKSIVLLDVIDHSLQNAIHHFRLKDGYRTKTLRLNEGVVNHYKYQAWSEFKAKFRRRVSAYVVDWNQKVNPMSKDRTPGLGYEPIEPEGWANKFCEVNDSRLKEVTQRWFSLDSSDITGSKLAWQD
ncbi:hypothetical protein AQUCO_00700889v1 [Aquilegia coerulea]|uniref:Glycosyltransferase family 92 protein n=1 Tax=Aquilegia coerulea TaxID=218851 RepID=A0A2G5EM74_AQUCA|nr:hypothetical protein AQUCO_00700889v1 [Aquilegia coerulea]